MGCSDCFGCIGLQHKQYCILNKQYTKEEYEKLVPQIITHMQTIPAKNGSGTERGEFFPSSISPFGYNETVAMEYISLTKEEALTKEYKRMDKEYFVNIPDNYEKIVANNLPYNIDEISDDIINKVILCEASAKPFRIIKSELDFYRNHHLPLPRRHPDQRHLERVQKRPERELYLRNCDHCKEENISIYPQDTTFKVYCEECYSREIY